MAASRYQPGGVSESIRPAALLPHGAPREFHLLAKPTGAVCNLDCSYCFFLSKELLYPGSRFRMADDLLEAYLRQLIEAHAGAPEVVVSWQGGEPTMMGLDFFRRSVELADGMKRPGQRIAYTIQTNGTLLDEDWAAFFKEHGFLVGLSVDGPRDLHDAYRVDKGGKGSFDRVMKGLAVRENPAGCRTPRVRPSGLAAGRLWGFCGDLGPHQRCVRHEACSLPTFMQVRGLTFGSRAKTRTWNLPVNSRTLCRLSYAGSTG